MTSVTDNKRAKKKVSDAITNIESSFGKSSSKKQFQDKSFQHCDSEKQEFKIKELEK